MGIEAFAEAALWMVPGWHVEAIEEVDFLAPFKFYRNEPRTLTIQSVFYPQGDDLTADCRLTGSRPLPNQPEPQLTTHFTARVRLTKQPQPVAVAAPPPNAPAGSTMEAADIYRVYFHGPAYQVLERAWRDGDRIIGLMAKSLPSNHHPSERPTLAAPRLIELCFQTAGLWEMSVQGRMGLPLHVASGLFLARSGAGWRGRPARGSSGRGCARHDVRSQNVCRGHSRPRSRMLPCRSCRYDGKTVPTFKRLSHGGAPEQRRCRAAQSTASRSVRDLMSYEFQRVAIVNRGEAAMRFIHAVREFNQEQGTSLRTIGLFTEPDRHAMFVREADEAVLLGPAQVIDPSTQQPKSSYVDYARLGRALAKARADAVWVGWGFVAEHAEFADLCRELGIVFIGPDGDVMRLLGDKITSKLLAEQAHLPVAPWSGGPVETLDEAGHHAQRLGYPLLIKATAGGGGRGIRRVDSASELSQAFEGARAEAFKAFGDPTVFMEQLVEGARHVEVQIIADHFGTTWAAGVRDCTIQRRHQKILEEAPSPALSPAQDQELRQAAVRLSQAAGYHNAGTVEFLYEPESQRFSFMEMNTRLQVEHPVTECTTGLDLVKLQIHVARGGRLEGEPPRTTGHAIEVRLNAEDPDNNFAPAPGAIERFKTPTGPGLRIDTGVAVGDAVPSEFDSMIAKIIAFGQNRNEALARLQRALRESVVVIKGGASNKAFLLELLGRAEVKSGQVDIGWLDRLAANGEHLSKSYADVALVQAAIEAYDAELAVEQKQFYASALRGRPHVRSEVGRTVELRYRGHSYSLQVYRLGPEQYRVEADGSRLDVHIDRLGPFEYWLTGLDRRFHVVSIVQGHSYRIEVDGVSHRVDRDEGGVIHAPAPAVVVSIAVKPGDTVAMGDRLAVLEAMKMEMQVVAPFSGKVRQVMTIPNVQVGTGTPLVQMEPIRGRRYQGRHGAGGAGGLVRRGQNRGSNRFSLPPEPARTPAAHAGL